VQNYWRTLNAAPRADQASALIFTAMIGLVLFTFQDYGLAWDEPFGEHYGALIVDYILSDGLDQRVNTFRNLQNYGGLFDGLAALATRISPLEPFQTRHLLIACTGLLGASGVWAMARALAGAAAGFWALAIIFCLPSYTGHMFFNAKDIPFAAGTIWALYFAMRAASELPRVSNTVAVGLGVALGATMGVRIGGVVLIAYLAVMVGLHFGWRQGRSQALAQENIRAMARTASIIGGISFILTFALWPSAWPWMFDQALTALLLTAKFKFDVDVLFQGELVNARALPLAYLPVYFAVKLPEVVLVLFAFSVPLAMRRMVRAYNQGERPLVFGYVALALGLFFPLGFAMVIQSAHYDAIRHFLFVLPPLSVLIGVELSGALTALKQKRRVLATLTGTAVVAGLALPIAAMIELHPYAYTYYNRLTGGVAGAQGHYELDYWATSYREAAQALRTAPGISKTGDITVYVCGPTDSAARFLPPRFKLVKNLAQAQFFIAFTRWSCDALVEAPILYTVERAGARYAVVKDLRTGFTLSGNLPNMVIIDKEYPRYGQN